ncbi:MAG: hypothetical protein ACLU30_03510 [Odoribacter splanchnicus]
MTLPILLDGEGVQIIAPLLRNRLRFASCQPIHSSCQRYEESILFFRITEQERQTIFDPSAELNAWG